MNRFEVYKIVKKPKNELHYKTKDQRLFDIVGKSEQNCIFKA